MADRKEGPVEQPSMANGANLALEDFNIPRFPREAGGLMALTLISQIKAEEYREVLDRPYEIKHLPPSIQALTLELFTLGYPPGFLKALIVELPELRSLVVYGQQFTGTSEQTSEDAVAFIKGAKRLRDLHFLDAIVSGTFVKSIAPIIKELEKPLMFVEINYTYRGDESLFKRIPAAELPFLVHQGMISCSFNISPPEVKKSKEQNMPAPQVDGIKVLEPSCSKSLVERLLDDETAPKVMKHLNITLYPISVSQLQRILMEHKGLMVLNVSIAVKNGLVPKKELFEMLVTATNLEQVEVVLCPENASEDLDVTVDELGLKALAKACKRLTSFKVNQLRCSRTKSSIGCTLENDKWQIELNKPEKDSASLPDRTKAAKSKPKQAWSPWT